MKTSFTRARLSEEGVFFTIAAGFEDRECLVSPEALAKLAAEDVADFLAVYQQHEYDIHLAARRLFLAGETAYPLIVDASAIEPLHRQH